ncbi:hypothetical protein ACFWXH_07280 [Mesorhizobium sp. NPDC059054]|uniref:hypothetical protein n=1 Tax=unclassified Mesorhizobium TaxID=325217 RepID=UPI0036D01699
MVKTAGHYLDDDSGLPAETALSSCKRKVNDAVLEQTIRLFESRTGRSMSKEDARQIVENVSGFFRILSDWDRTERAQKSVPRNHPAE